MPLPIEIATAAQSAHMTGSMRRGRVGSNSGCNGRQHHRNAQVEHIGACRWLPNLSVHARWATVNAEQFWLSIGFLAQAFFSMRFIVQWVASERHKDSVFPVAFWFFSLAGGLTLFTYALHRQDPVFVLGEAAGVLIYLRNLYLIWRKQHSWERGGG